MTLSGRGDKDLAEVTERLRRPGVLMTGTERIAAAFEAARGEGRAALMPYMMGGFPDDDTARRSHPRTRTPAPTWSSSACRSPTRSPTAR